MNFAIHEGPATGTTVVLRVEGRLDGENAPRLLERGGAVADTGRDLVLSLAGVTFLGSSGVGALLALHEQFEERGRVARFAALSEEARVVIELLDLGPYLAIHATEDEALAA